MRRARHAAHDYGIVYTKLFEEWLQKGETALGYGHPMSVEGGVMMSPSPVPTQDNARISQSPAIQIFGAARERRLYALPDYTTVESIGFDDLAFLPQAQKAACAICGCQKSFLDNLGSSLEPRWVCSDSEGCRSRHRSRDV